MKYSIAFLPLILMGLTACEADKQGIGEKAAIEGKASSEAGVRAENANLAAKAREMETDLSVRHRFYQAVRGTFEGDLESSQGTFRIRLTLVPSLNPYVTPRTRQLDEIVSDLNNLYFNAQVLQWNSANPLSAVGCRVSGIRPDLLNGEITIAAESCPNLYTLRIGEGNSPQIAEGKLSSIDAISGEVHPSTNPLIYHFVARRTQ